MRLRKKLNTSHLYIRVLTTVLLAIIAVMTVTFSGNVNATEEKPKEQLLALMANAVIDPTIAIAYCKVPEKTLENDIILKRAADYSEIIVVKKILVTEKIRHDMDTVIFVKPLTWLIEGWFPPRFRSQPTSEWVLFLESPFSDSHPFHASIMKTYDAIKADTFLSPRNFFSLYGYGYGAVCVHWPEAAEYPPSVVATRGFVEDLKLIVKRFKDFSNSDKDLEPEEKFLPRLQDEFGRLLYRKVFNAE